MKYSWITVGAAFFILLLIVIMMGPQKRATAPQSGEDRLQVAATIYPLYDIVREVAGEHADVKLIVPPGASPHLFEFTPRQLQDLQRTRVLFQIGHGLDSWVSHIESVVPSMVRITADKNITLRQSSAPDHDDEKKIGDTDGEDPHYWLHFGNARIMVSTIAEGLAAADPTHAISYRKNAAGYQSRLIEKEQELVLLLAPARGKKILTLHDAWYYFSDNFGLTVAGAFEPAAGGEPTPQYLAHLREDIKQYGIPVLFSEPQLATVSLATFAHDEGLRLGILDPIGGLEQRMTYLELMEYNARSIRSAFSDAQGQQ